MSIHMIVGSITLILYIINLVMYGIEMGKGTALPYHRLVSVAAATALLLQWALGFMLLGEGEEITVWHIVLALATILPVGMEHMTTAREGTIRQKGTMGVIATAITVVLVLAAYALGEMA